MCVYIEYRVLILFDSIIIVIATFLQYIDLYNYTMVYIHLIIVR